LESRGVDELPKDPAQRGRTVLEAVDALLKELPDNIGLLRNRADALTELGRESEAQAIYEQILQRNPNDAEVLANLSSLASRAKDYARARGLLLRAVKAAPEREDIASRLVETELVCQGAREWPTNEPEQSQLLIRAIESLRRELPMNNYLLTLVIQIRVRLAHRARDVGAQAMAVAHFQQAVESLHSFLDTFGEDADDNNGYLLAECYRPEAGDTLKAHIESLRDRIHLSDNRPRDLYNTACAFALVGDKSAVLWALGLTIGFDPKHARMAREDSDLRRYWEDPDFRAVTGRD